MGQSSFSRRAFLRKATVTAACTSLAPLTAWNAWAQSAPVIDKITILEVPGAFYRPIAMNAQDDSPKGKTGTVRLARAVLSDGTVGIGVEGYHRIDDKTVAGLKRRMIGTNPLEVYASGGEYIQGLASSYQDFLTQPRYAWFESVLLDLIGKLKQTPVYALFGSSVRQRVDAYDGTLYFKDIELETGPEVIGELAARIQEDGYSALKMKVGRPNKWMAKKEGVRRDIAAVKAARGAVGSNMNIMADANNGYAGQIRLGLRFLKSVGPQELYWIEELIPEEQRMYAQLRQTLFSEGISLRTADGETALWTDESPIQSVSDLKPWVENDHFDVVQPDLRTVGFTNAIRMADIAGRYGASLVPHNWQSELGKIMSVHLAKLRENVRFVEDDRWSNYALDSSDYQFRDGRWVAPETPGWGIRLSDHYDRFAEAGEERVIAA